MLRRRFSPIRPLAAIAIGTLFAFVACSDKAPNVTGVEPPALAKGGGGGGGGGTDPTVDAVDPTEAPQGVTLDVRVFGTGFDDGSSVKLLLNGKASKKVKTNSTRFVSGEELVANITIALDAEVASYDVAVTTSRRRKGVGTALFSVKETPGQGQDIYEYTFSGDIESAPFLATTSSKDPFGVNTDGVTLHFPDGNLAEGCLADLETDWGLHQNVDYTGSLKFSAPKRKTIQVLNFFDDADPDARFMNLAVQLREETEVTKDIGDITSTLEFANATALVGQGSHPPNEGPDGKDRCVTFTITAVRQ